MKAPPRRARRAPPPSLLDAWRANRGRGANNFALLKLLCVPAILYDHAWSVGSRAGTFPLNALVPYGLLPSMARRSIDRSPNTLHVTATGCAHGLSLSHWCAAIT